MSAQIHKSYIGRCISAGKVPGIVQARVSTRVWNKQVDKTFLAPFNMVAIDHNNSVRTGDVIRIDITHYRQHASGHKREVAAILAPFGTPVSERPAVPSADERLRQWTAEDERKHELKQQQRLSQKEAMAKQVSERNAKRSIVVAALHAKAQHGVAERKSKLVEALAERFAAVKRSVGEKAL